MNTKIFSIYDAASQAYMMPFFSPQNASAIRAVVSQLKDPNSMLALNPADFTLFCVGSFDDQTGLINIGQEHPEIIGKCVDYLDLSINRVHPLSDATDAHREQLNLHGNPS